MKNLQFFIFSIKNVKGFVETLYINFISSIDNEISTYQSLERTSVLLIEIPNNKNFKFNNQVKTFNSFFIQFERYNIHAELKSRSETYWQ